MVVCMGTRYAAPFLGVGGVGVGLKPEIAVDLGLKQYIFKSIL